MQVTGTDEQRSAMFKALAKVQGEYEALKRSKTVDTGKYKFNYCPLEEMLSMALPKLSANGLAMTQHMDTDQGPDGKLRDILVTMITHESGAFFSSIFSLPGFDDMQGLGSDITYLRRYAASCALGLAPEDDDDANKGRAESVAPRENRVAKNEVRPTGKGTSAPPQNADSSDVQQLRAFMEGYGFDTPDKRAAKYKAVAGKAPIALTTDDIASIRMVVEAEAALR